MTTANDWRISKVRTPVDKAMLEAYQQGLRDGRATKPLRWRTGPVPHRGVRYLTKESGITSGRVVVKAGWTVDESDAWLPLSEILDLIGE